MTLVPTFSKEAAEACSTKTTERARALGAIMMLVAGLELAAFAALLLTRSLLADPSEPRSLVVATTATQEFAWTLPILARDYVACLQFALVGFLAATGWAIAFVAWYGVRSGQRWAWWTVSLMGVPAVLAPLPFYVIYGPWTLVSLCPIYYASVLLAVGAYLTRPQQ